MGRGKKITSSAKSFDIEHEIDLVAKSLARKVFQEIDIDKGGSISVEEFLIWHSMLDASKQNLSESFRKKKNDELAVCLEEARRRKQERIRRSEQKKSNSGFKVYENEEKKDIVANQAHKTAILRFREKKSSLNLSKIRIPHVQEVADEMKTTDRINRADFHLFFSKVIIIYYFLIYKNNIQYMS